MNNEVNNNVNNNDYSSMLLTDEDKKNKDTYKLDDKPEKKSIKGNLYLIGFILILLVFGVSFYIFYNSVLTPANLVFSGFLNVGKSFDFLVEPLENNYEDKDISINSGNLNINVVTTTDDSTINLGLDYVINSNVKNNKYLVDINTKFMDRDFLEFKGYYENDSIYMYLKDIYDKYLKIDMNNTSLSQEDTLYLIEVVKDAITLEFSKLNSSKSISLASNKMPVVVLDLEINSENINNIYKEITKDKKAMDILTKLDIYEEDLEISDTSNEVIKILVKANLFTNTLYEFEIETSEDKFSYSNYNDKKYSIISEEETIEMEVVKSSNSGDNFTLNIYEGRSGSSSETNREQIASLKGMKDKNGYIYTYATMGSDMERMNLSLSIENEVTDNKLNYKYDLVANMNEGIITLTLNGSTSEGPEFSEDISDAINFENLTDNDMETISNKFLNLLIEAFPELFGSYSDDLTGYQNVDTNQI